MIRKAKVSDVERIREIYNHYVINTDVSLEYDPLSFEEMKNRFESISSSHPYIVYEENNLVLGYGYLTDFKPRKGYMYSKEVSVYLDKNLTQKGNGSKIFAKLKQEAKERGYKELIFSISTLNTSSILFFKKFGAQEVGVLKNVGFKFNKTTSVSLLQLSLVDSKL